MFNAKFVFLFSVTLSIAAVLAKSHRKLGGVTQLEGDDLKKAVDTLNSSLAKLGAGDGPYYSISKVISTTRQLVAGLLYKYEVELIDSNKAIQKCKVKILTQPRQKDGIKVTFDCEGEKKIVKKYNV